MGIEQNPVRGWGRDQTSNEPITNKHPILDGENGTLANIEFWKNIKIFFRTRSGLKEDTYYEI